MDDKLGQLQVGLPVFCLVFVFFLEGKLSPASVTAVLLLQEVVLAARGCDASGLMYRGDASFNKKADRSLRAGKKKKELFLPEPNKS